MAQQVLTGSRVRERRMSLGIRQVDLARRAGISASYLNLIEHNRRNIGGKLLLRLAAELSVEPTELSGVAQRALTQALRLAAERAEAPIEGTDHFAARFPDWARLVARQDRRIESLRQAVETLTDRLTHDPNLAASLHDVISTVTAIRSTASILVDETEIQPEWRTRFHRNIREDAERLAESSRMLVRYLDGARDAEAEVTAPEDELARFLDRHGHHFPALEQPGAGAAEIERCLDGLGSAARFLLRRHLHGVLAAVRAMPLDKVGAALGAGADPLAVAAHFGVGAALAMRRLASLPLALAPPSLGYVVADSAGALLYRKPVDGFAIPRFGGACALWPLFGALSAPLTPLRSLLRAAGRDDALFEAWAVAEPAPGDGPAQGNRPPRLETAMLIRPAVMPRPGGTGEGLAVGSTCRLCPRADCPARRTPAVGARGF